jgi:hypothetical protein
VLLCALHGHVTGRPLPLSISRGGELTQMCLIVLVKGLTKVRWVVISRAVEAYRRQEGHELLRYALVHTQPLRYYVDVVEQLEERRTWLMYRADDSAALPRQSSQEQQYLLCGYVVQSAAK